MMKQKYLIANDNWLRHSWGGFEGESECSDEEGSKVSLKQNRPQLHLKIPNTNTTSGLLSPISNLSHSLDLLGIDKKESISTSPTKPIELEVPSTVQKKRPETEEAESPSSRSNIEGLLDTPIVRSSTPTEDDEFKSPSTESCTTKNVCSTGSAAKCISSNIELDSIQPEIEASPYKTPTKKDDEEDFELSPEFKVVAFRPVVKLQPTLRRARSISYSVDQIHALSEFNKSRFLQDITNTVGQQATGKKPPKCPPGVQPNQSTLIRPDPPTPIAVEQAPKRRKMGLSAASLARPFATSPPLRSSFDATSSSEAGERITRSRSMSICEGQGYDLPRISRTLSYESLVDQYRPILPTIRGSHPDLNCISPDTVRDVIDGKYCQHYDQVFILDCRFDFEYQGGHVMTAKHMPNPEDLKESFIKDPILDRKIAIIFYCEFSSKRGPTGYRTLRKLDREANTYPDLYYREVYLIEGGYKNFFEHFQDYCDPRAYVEMRDPQFNEDMKKQYKELKTRHSCKRSRSLTFSRELVGSLKKDFI